MKKIFLQFTMLFFFVLFQFQNNVQARVLAVIEKPGIKLSEQDLERYISYYGQESKAVLSSPQKRLEFLENLVKMLAVAAKAREEGLDREPEIKDQIEFLTQKFLAKKYLTRRLEAAMARVRFTEEDLRTYYRTHPEEFRLPAKVRFTALVLKGEDPEALRQEAKRLQTALNRGELSLHLDYDFYFVRDSGLKPLNELDPPLRQALEELPKGQWSQPIAYGSRVVMVKKLAFEPATRRPFAEVKEEIHKRLLSEARRLRLRTIVQEILKEQGARLLTTPSQGELDSSK
jgi:hypothetical protein